MARGFPGFHPPSDSALRPDSGKVALCDGVAAGHPPDLYCGYFGCNFHNLFPTKVGLNSGLGLSEKRIGKHVKTFCRYVLTICPAAWDEHIVGNLVERKKYFEVNIR